jgi:hypothetical protein
MSDFNLIQWLATCWTAVFCFFKATVLFSATNRMTLNPTQHLMQWVLWLFPHGWSTGCTIQNTIQQTKIMHYGTTIKSEAGAPLWRRSPPTSSVTIKSRSPLLLGHCSWQLCKSRAVAKMVNSRAKCMFILKHCFVPKLLAADHEAFSFAYPNKEVPNKRVHQHSAH